MILHSGLFFGSPCRLYDGQTKDQRWWWNWAKSTSSIEVRRPEDLVNAFLTMFSPDYLPPAPVKKKTVWQLQPKVAPTVQQHVSYEFIWIRWTCDYIYLNVLYCVLFSSRVMVRIRFSVCSVSICAPLGCKCNGPSRNHLPVSWRHSVD